MTAPITSARVRELSAKASKGGWYRAGAAFFSNHHAEDPRLGECFGRSSDDAALIAALCSEPARDRIAKALSLLERVEAGDAGLVEAMIAAFARTGALAANYAGNVDKLVAEALTDETIRALFAAALAALVGEG